MKLDYELISEILAKFVESEKSIVDINDFVELYEQDSQKLAHHMIIMQEKRLITGAFSHGGLGIDLEYREGKDIYEFAADTPWRITSEGYDFAAALNKPTVLSEIKTRFQKEGLSVVIDVANKIATKQATKYLDD